MSKEKITFPARHLDNYFAKDKDGNLFQFAWSEDDKLFINKDGAPVEVDKADYEIIEGDKMEKGGKAISGSSWSKFWNGFGDDGALITGGSYFDTEKKDFGGTVLGLLFGGGLGYIAGAASKQKGYPSKIKHSAGKSYMWAGEDKGWEEITDKEFAILSKGGLYKYDHIKQIYKLKIFEKGGKTGVDFKELAKTNVWGLDESDIKTLEKDGELDTEGHWKFNKVKKEYEAVYDGSYMHVFESLEDLMNRKNEKAYYEYDEDKSEKEGQETFVDANGKVRKYEKGGKIGGYDEKTVEAIQSWGDHDWYYVNPKDVLSLWEKHGIYAHDLKDDSEFLLTDSRSNEDVQSLIDSGDFAFFSEDKINGYDHPEIFACGGQMEKGGSAKHYPQKRVSMTKRGVGIDKKVPAKHSGWRISGGSDRTPTHAEITAGKTKDGKSVYFERRINRSDRHNSSR